MMIKYVYLILLPPKTPLNNFNKEILKSRDKSSRMEKTGKQTTATEFLKQDGKRPCGY